MTIKGLLPIPRHVIIRYRPRHYTYYGREKDDSPRPSLANYFTPLKVVIGDADEDEIGKEHVKETEGINPRGKEDRHSKEREGTC